MGMGHDGLGLKPKACKLVFANSFGGPRSSLLSSFSHFPTILVWVVNWARLACNFAAMAVGFLAPSLLAF